MAHSHHGFDLFEPSNEHRQLRNLVRSFVEQDVEPKAEERDQKEHFDRKLFSKLGELGFLGVTVLEKYGGSGMDPVAAVIIHEELSTSDPGLCLAYLAHSMLCANNIQQNASEEQKHAFLPKLCSGEWIGAMAMSEPDVGTDVLGMKSQAKKSSEGYVLNGRKTWITNGAVDEKKTPADVVYLYAKTGEVSDRRNISSFLVKKGNAGYFVGQKLTNKLGMRASITAELVFEDCILAPNQIVGEEGQALIHMMRNLEIERVTLAAMSLGIARRSLQIMNRYAQERTSFGKPLTHFGQIQRYIAESYAKYKACRAYVYNTASKIALHEAGNRIDSDGVKLITSQMGKEIADHAIQVLGGNGYMGEYVVERLWRDAKLLEIGGGTLEAHQKNMVNDLSKYPEAI